MRYILIAIFGLTAGLWGVDPLTLKGFSLMVCLAILSDALSIIISRNGENENA